jgi:thiol-disulfide isomerase/thioredoxin
MLRIAICVRFLILTLAFSTAHATDDSAPGDIAGSQGGSTATTLVWMTPDGPVWKLPIGIGDGGVQGLESTPTDLQAPRWYTPLPDLEIPLLDGGSFELASARGKLLLLDFWASWCAPCLDELPQLQSLWESARERGLVAVAINAQEPDELARRTAKSLGLTLPIGRYTNAAHRELRVNTLPTVILADRNGRVRERWNGYVTGLERAIAESVRALLEDDSGGEPVTVAHVLSGEGRLGVRWRRELRAKASGLAVVRARDETARITISEPGRVSSFGADGRTQGRITVPPEVGRLVHGDPAGDRPPVLVGFRPGGDRLALVEAAAGRHRLLDAPATVMDVAVLIDPGEEARARLVLATVDGLYSIDVDGGTTNRIGEPGRRTGVAAPRGGELVALDADRDLTWHDAEGRATGRTPGPADGWTLVADGESAGVGVLPAGEIAAATGSFSGGGRREVAVAGPSGHLVVAEIESGETVFLARWPGVSGLAAGDLDGDGNDELIVADGGALTVLEGRPE